MASYYHTFTILTFNLVGGRDSKLAVNKVRIVRKAHICELGGNQEYFKIKTHRQKR